MKRAKIYIDDVLVNTGTCGLSTSTYSTSSFTEGIRSIKLEVYDVTETVSDYIIWTVTVTPSTYEMLQPVNTGAMFIATSMNMTNSTENREIWVGRDQEGNVINATLNEFAFNQESGWINNELLMTGASSVDIPIAPLSNNARYGFTLDIEFASKAIGVEDALVLNLWDDEKNCGVKITTEQVIIRSAEGNEAKLYYTDDEMTSVIFIIDRNEATAKIYLNGVMCSAFHLSDYYLDGVAYLEDFTVNSELKLGGSGHSRIKNLRVYQVALTSDEILNNFMANETSKAAQKELVAFQKGDHLPTLTVYCDFSGLGKDDKKPCKIVYTSTDEEKYGKSFILNHYESQLQYQGTSSMAYPIKNYRLNLRDENGDKWYYDFPKGKPECRFTLKADFMSSGHWTNTGLTKWINDNLYNYNTKDEKSMNPKKWYDIQNGGSLDDTRECIYGFPCRLILINDGNTPLNEGQNEPTPGNTKDMGIFNFNHDKDATDTMGFDDDVFPNCASYEVTANSDTSAGAFMSMPKKVIDSIGMVKAGSWITDTFPVAEFEAAALTFESDGTFSNACRYWDSSNSINYFSINSGSLNLTDKDIQRIEIYFDQNGPTPTYLKVNGIHFNLVLHSESKVLLDSIYVEVDPTEELDYIKQSFELRFPDEDDVPEGWGFMYADSSAPCIDVYNSYGGSYKSTPLLSATYFGTNTFSIKAQPSRNISVYTDYGEIFYSPIPTSITLNEGSSFRILFPSNTNLSTLEHIIINDEYYNANVIEKDVDVSKLYSDPYMIDIIDNSLGLKALIDWVDGSTDEEFINEFEEHFNKDYTFRYFLLVITLGMVDNLGKNMMLDTWDNKIFMPRFYDCDTICSYDNSGQLKFDVDIEMAQGYWNTSSSRLWTRIRDLFHDELVAKYNNMRQNGLSYESLMQCFYDEQIAKIPQKYYNMDYDVKYAPFADSYIGMANGDVYEHVKRWLQQRLRFVDTLYDYAPSYNNDVLTIRANTTEPMTLYIETYTPVYQHLSWYNNQMDKKKIDGKIAVEFTGTAMAATDQEVLIYGGSNIKSIKGIQSMNPNRMLIGAATRLTELDASNCPLLADVNANKANFAPHVYLNKLDISGCPLLGGNLIVSNSPLLQEIDIRGTAITGLNLPSNLRNLKELKLPAAIPSLTLNDAGQLHTIIFENGVKLQNISMTNCNALVNVENFDMENASSVTLNNSYNSVQELYFRDTTNLSLSNMPNLERIIYTPNDEYAVFNRDYLATKPDYTIRVFNAPKCTEFIITAPQRLSYGLDDTEIKPDTVFAANSIDISNARFTDVKLLSTTDVNRLKLPNTVTNLIIDSAYDIDTDVITDANYDFIHDDLYDAYNTNYVNEVETSSGYTPDIVPSSSDGSLIYGINSDEDGVWDMDGMLIGYFHIFGVNNDVKKVDDILTMPDRTDDYTYKLDNLTIDNEVMRYTATTENAFPTFNTGFEYYSIIDHKEGEYLYRIIAENDTLLTTMTCTNSTIKKMITSVEYLDTSNITTMSSMFNGCSNLTSVDLSNSNTTNVTSMSYMFTSCSALTSLNLSNFDTSNVTNMRNMFQGCKSLTSLDLSSFDTSKVTNMYAMFQECGKLTSLDLSNFKTTNVTDMAVMFNSCSALTSLDLSSFDTSKVTTMRSMFYGCSNLTSLDLSNFKTPMNADFSYMFRDCKVLTSLDVGSFDTSNVTNMRSMFEGCHKLASLDLSNFDTTKVTNMAAMFAGCNALTSVDLSSFDTSSVTSMKDMFLSCIALTSLDLSNFDTTKVTSMTTMFKSCNALTSLDVSGWPLTEMTQSAISSLPVGNDATNEIYATASFTVPSGWSLINTASRIMNLRQTDLDNLTDEEIAALVDEGWTIG